MPAAAGLSVDVKGLKRLQKRLGTLPKSVRSAVNKTVNKAAAAMRTEVRRSIRKSSGQWNFYEPDHWSSPPGTAPNNDTGQLMMSIIISQRATVKNVARATVTADAPYAAALEFGTMTIEPRPFMKPAFQKVAPEAKKNIENAVKAAMLALGRGT